MAEGGSVNAACGRPDIDSAPAEPAAPPETLPEAVGGDVAVGEGAVVWFAGVVVEAAPLLVVL